MLKADEVRDRYDIPPDCGRQRLRPVRRAVRPAILVRFKDIEHGGLLPPPGEARDLARRCGRSARRMFNCAHELGHHVFGHGSTLDELKAESEAGRSFEPDEFLVDTFAGYLLMPRMAVMNAFRQRGWKAEDADSEQYFVVSCSLGVGFETLASHCFFSLKLIGEAAYRTPDQGRPADDPATRCSGSTPRTGCSSIDAHHTLPTADTEVGTGVLLPYGHGGRENTNLANSVRHPARAALHGDQAGHHAGLHARRGWAIVVRVMRDKYNGLSRYRHLAQRGRRR